MGSKIKGLKFREGDLLPFFSPGFLDTCCVQCQNDYVAVVDERGRTKWNVNQVLVDCIAYYSHDNIGIALTFKPRINNNPNDKNKNPARYHLTYEYYAMDAPYRSKGRSFHEVKDLVKFIEGEVSKVIVIGRAYLDTIK